MKVFLLIVICAFTPVFANAQVSDKKKEEKIIAIEDIEILDFAIHSLDNYGNNVKRHINDHNTTISVPGPTNQRDIPDLSFYNEVNKHKFIVDYPQEHTSLLPLTEGVKKRKDNARTLANEYAEHLVMIIMSDMSNADYYVKCIRHHCSLFYVEQIVSDIIIDINDDKYVTQDFNWPVAKIEDFAALHELVHCHMNDVFDRNFTFYSYLPDNKIPLKAIMLNLDNDVFAFYDNRDREYTGGGQLEFATDYLKMDLFPNLFARRPMYCYQSIITGAVAYTPDFQKNSMYNPDNEIFIQAHAINPDTLLVDSLDRPFASFQYWGRAKYKIQRHGIFRSSSYIKIGKMGGNTTESVQYKIHRDITYASTNPVVWNTQIASGGRLGLSIEYNPEFMLLSKTGDVFDKLITRVAVPRWLNASFRSEFKFGTMQTSMGGSLILCKNDFRKSGGGSPILAYNGYMYPALDGKPAPRKNSFFYSVRYGIKYVFYDGMLQGYGFTKPIPDEQVGKQNGLTIADNDALPADRYVLTEDQVKQVRSEIDFAVGVRCRYTTIYYRWVAVSPHTNLEKSSDWHFWASVGLNFIIPYKHHT